jgi:5'(3')-deoxyribonucleotidase
MKQIIFLDMDGVLVDFEAGAAALWGLTAGELQAKRTPGTWALPEPLGITTTQFWNKLNEAGEIFWQGLLPMPWHLELMHYVEEHSTQWYIVSAPSHSPTSYTGKVKWLKKYFGPRFDRFFLTPHKELLAANGRLLIDDNEDNIKKFVEHGGMGQIFPSMSNRLHSSRLDPMVYIKNWSRICT